MAFGLAVYASQGRLPDTTQDSLPVAGQALPDGIPTRRVPMKGFKFVVYISFPFPKLSWRNRCNRRALKQFGKSPCLWSAPALTIHQLKDLLTGFGLLLDALLDHGVNVRQWSYSWTGLGHRENQGQCQWNTDSNTDANIAHGSSESGANERPNAIQAPSF